MQAMREALVIALFSLLRNKYQSIKEVYYLLLTLNFV
jgi:hypothetical protein